MAEVIELKVPDIGDFDGVEVIDVMVAAGDTIAVDDPLITLETDKAAMDVPATHAGTIKTLKVKSGDKVSEGDVILVLEPVGDSRSATEESRSASVKRETDVADHRSAPTGDNGGSASVKRDADKAKESGSTTEDSGSASVKRDADVADHRSAPTGEAPAPTGEAPAPTGEAPAPTGGSRDSSGGAPPHASPSVRKFARELGVDLTRVDGSGRKGRITHDDVKAFVKGTIAAHSAAPTGAAPTGAAPTGAAPTAGFALPAMPAVDFSKWGEVETRPLSRIKRLSGPHLQRAWVTVPHVTQHDEADITDLEALRKVLKGDAEKVGAKLTPLAFVAKACVHALKAYPEANASLDASGENLVLKHYFHIGFAVDTPEGLVVPVIRDVDDKSVFDIATALGDISQRARDKKLKAEDMQGGSFSISSLGGIGGTAFTPIVNAPEVAILGVSRAYMKPVWDGGKFEPRLMLPLSLSYDHRVIDGAAAARFTTYLAEVLKEVRNLVL